MSKILLFLLLFSTAQSQIKWENVAYSTGGVVLFGVADYVLYQELKDGDLSVYRYIIQPALDLIIASTLYLITDDIKVSIGYGVMRMFGGADAIYYTCYGSWGGDNKTGFKHLKYFVPFTKERSSTDFLLWNGMGISITIFINQ